MDSTRIRIFSPMDYRNMINHAYKIYVYYFHFKRTLINALCTRAHR